MQNDRKMIDVALNLTIDSSRSQKVTWIDVRFCRRSFLLHSSKKVVFIEYVPLERRRVFQRPLFFSGAVERWKVHSLQIDEPASGMRWSIFLAALNCVCAVSCEPEYLLERESLRRMRILLHFDAFRRKYTSKEFNECSLVVSDFVWSAVLNLQIFFTFFFFR